MALTPSQKPTREWPLLVLTLGLVGLICLPLWQGMAADTATTGDAWSVQRWGRLLLGPEQIACYVCFFWAAFILISRTLEVRRQRQAFAMGLLPTDEGARILLADARPLQRKLDHQTAARGPFILGNLIRTALSKFALSRNSTDVSDAIRTQAEVDQGRLVSSMAVVHYLAWAIPAIGFLGTVRGLAGSMSMAEQGGEQIRIATRHLTFAFDCTLVALAMSVMLMFLVHLVQRSEEALVIDCQQYCLEHLVNRIYEPEVVHEGSHGAHGPLATREPTGAVSMAGSLGERLMR